MRFSTCLIISASLISLTITPILALAPPDKYSGTDFMRPDRDALSGFPGNYEETSLCKPYEFTGPFKNIFIAKSFPPGFRATLEKTIIDSDAGTIVTDASKADYLVEMDKTALDVGFYRTYLWAVNSRPKATKMGLRCIVSSDMQLNDQPVQFKKIVGFMLINGTGDRGPRHFAFLDRYNYSSKCYGYISDADILAFKNIYIEMDTPPNLREYMASTLATSSNVRVVTKSSEADYMVSITREAGKITKQTQDPDYVQFDWNAGRAYRRSGEIKTSTSYYDVGELTIRGVQHPADANSKGLYCDIYSKKANKVSGLIGKQTKDPGKRLTAELLRFLSNPDLSYGQSKDKY